MSVNLSLEIKRKMVLLKQSDDKPSNLTVGSTFDVSKSTVGRVLKEFRDGEFDLEDLPTTPIVEVELVVDEPEIDVDAIGEDTIEISTKVVYVIGYLDDAGILPAVAEDDLVARIIAYRPGTSTSLFNINEAVGEEPEMSNLVVENTLQFKEDYPAVKGSVYYVTEQTVNLINRAINFVVANGNILATDVIGSIVKHDTNLVPYPTLKSLYPKVSSSSYSRATKSIAARMCSFMRGAFDGDDIEEMVEDVANVVDPVSDASKCPTEAEIVEAIRSGECPFPMMCHKNSIVMVDRGQPMTVDKTHSNYIAVCKAIVSRLWQKALSLCDVAATINRTFEGQNIKVEKGTLSLDGNVVDGRLSDRIIDAVNIGNVDEFTQRLVKFLAKVDENPSNQIVSRIYDFLAFNDIEIDADGDILAYKVVDPNFKDLRTHTMDNSVGKVVKIKRHQVDERMERTCSYGLHVCAVGYIESYSGNPHRDKVIRIKMNPADVVAIPKDYGNAKVRCCKYTVLADVTDDYLRGKITHEVRDYDGNKV